MAAASTRPASFSLTLVRHAETPANKAQVIQGQQDVDLSPQGESQIRLLGSGFNKEAFTHVFSSDLIRCKKTADAVIQTNSIFRPIIKYEARLRERCFGVLEGSPAKQFMALVNASGLPDKSMFTPEGGESIEDMNSRVVGFFRDICAMVSKLEEDKVAYDEERRELAEQKQKYKQHTYGMHSVAASTGVTPHQSSGHIAHSLVPSLSLHAKQNTDVLKSISLSTTITVVRSLVAGAGKNLPVGTKSSSEFNEIRPGKQWLSYKRDTIADILLVTHGGVIRTLLTYFCDVLGCDFGVSRDVITRISPNTGVTRLVVFIYPDKPIQATCCMLHDARHLEKEAEIKEED